jgi:hypothetical protein
MESFSARTGLTSSQPSRRYLWTDAFAVCNYLGLARATGEKSFIELAIRLVNQVHHTLGRHRDDDKRTGWISGLDENDGELHPTRGGLRIGKTLPERGRDEPIDENMEWDRDGQYYHYLTKWMHALDQITRVTEQPQFNTWSRELAHAAFNAFAYTPSSSWQPPRMVWKMSIDLTYALVASMGQHDPLDGYITNLQLRCTRSRLPQPTTGPELEHETSQLAAMLKWSDWATADPLGLGGLMIDIWRAQQLRQQEALPDTQLLDNLISASLTGLQQYAQGDELQQPAQYRLAFRELGLAIGLHAVECMQQALNEEAEPSAVDQELSNKLRGLMQYVPLYEEIEAFWRTPENQQTTTWIEHQDINEVMLATSLAPDGFLLLKPL